MPGRQVQLRSRVRDAVSRYREARRALRTPASRHSRLGLDWMNFFIADVQTGFGTFVAFYLADLDWSAGSVGLALSVGGFAAVAGQIPGGAFADAVRWKRGLAAIGILMILGAALILALVPTFWLVLAAEALHGLTAGIITPVIGAISLGLVGRRAMSVRTGRNFRYAAAGHALTAALMGVAGAYLAPSAIFFAAALLCLPALVALSQIRSDEIDYARARNAQSDASGPKLDRVRNLVKNRGLVVFTICAVLFQFADASVLPLVGEHIARDGGDSASLLMSGLIIVPQIVVAMLAPWVGYHSEKKGRRPLLLIGFGIEPVRAALLAFTSGYPMLLLAQVLNGLSSATITVLTVLVLTDLTAGTGRFNLARGFVGAAMGLAAAASTGATGLIAQAFGETIGFIVIAAVAIAATAILWLCLGETRPVQYAEQESEDQRHGAERPAH
jgi:MFS family permease